MKRASPSEFEGFVDDSNPYHTGPVWVRRRADGVEIDGPDMEAPLALTWKELVRWARGVASLEEAAVREEHLVEMERRAVPLMARADKRYAEAVALLSRPMAVVCPGCKAAEIRRVELEELRGAWS